MTYRSGFNALSERHPYIVARHRFMDGMITRHQAAAMIASDPEFIAESALGHSALSKDDRIALAWRIVDEQWLPELVAKSTGRVAA
jgi:hypothetical protein